MAGWRPIFRALLDDLARPGILLCEELQSFSKLKKARKSEVCLAEGARERQNVQNVLAAALFPRKIAELQNILRNGCKVFLRQNFLWHRISVPGFQPATRQKKKKKGSPSSRIWTSDLRITVRHFCHSYSPPLYQLSYRRRWLFGKGQLFFTQTVVLSKTITVWLIGKRQRKLSSHAVKGSIAEMNSTSAKVKTNNLTTNALSSPFPKLQRGTQLVILFETAFHFPWNPTFSFLNV